MELFRYRSMEWGFSELEESYLWFSHPSQVNDVFDCNPSLSPIETVEEARLALVKFDDENFKADPIKTVQRAIDGVPDTPEALAEVNVMLKDNVDKIVDGMGVCCFSEKRDSLLMWSHYAYKCGGICICYETTMADCLNNKVKPVRYSSERAISLATLGDADSATNIPLTKALDWSYEREWRTTVGTIPPGPGYKLPVEAASVRAIYCGPKMGPDDLKRILDLRNLKYPTADVFRVDIHARNYQFIFEKIT